MKNKPLELECDFNKTDGKSGEKYQYRTIQLTEVRKESLFRCEGLTRKERVMMDSQGK